MARLPECRIGSCAARVLEKGGGGTIVAARGGAAFVQMSGGPVIAILPCGTPIHPWAISVELDPSHLTEGTRVRIGESVLAFGAALVPLREAELVDLEILERPATLPIESLRHIVNREDRDSRRDPHASGRLVSGPRPPQEREPGDPFEPAYARALADYCRGGELPGLIRILGLGKGLTPSGDDALAGLLAGMEFLRDAQGRLLDERRELASLLLPEMEEGTSLFSASILIAAIEGQYAEPILDLLDEIAREDVTPASLDAACAALLEVGHDSGASILDGVRAAFKRALILDPVRPLVVTPDPSG